MYPIQIINSGFTLEQFKNIDSVAELYPEMKGRTGMSHSSNPIVEGMVIGTPLDSHENNEIRNSEIRFLPKGDQPVYHIYKMIWNYVYEVNKHMFNYDIKDVESIQYTKYIGDAENGGHYSWHADWFVSNPGFYDRKISFILQLSNSKEYEGGDILFEGIEFDKKAIRKRGTIIIFPSFVKHCVTPVTSGIRKSLVSWIEGPKFK